jgi:Ca2+-binding RTX toxin-like protein
LRVPFSSESVTLAGSGLVFNNTYSSTVSGDYRAAIQSAENILQAQFIDPVTVNVAFDFQPLSASFGAGNQASALLTFSYDTLTSALRSHATTAADQLAVAGLPAFDPSNGVGFDIPRPEAQALGLAGAGGDLDLTVTLNSNFQWTYSQDVIGVMDHELTEGAMGRIGGLGLDGRGWSMMDLFRFTASGQRDYTGGTDGLTTYFGLDDSHVTFLAYHSSFSPSGADDHFDLADWDHTFGDAFGPGGPTAPGVMTSTDLQVVDILGWTPSGAPLPPPPPDDFANSLTDTSHPMGVVAPGGSITGVLDLVADRDWFSIQLQAGFTYTIKLEGASGGVGSLPDAYLRLHDAGGALLTYNNETPANPGSHDSQITYSASTSGTYYIEAGADFDSYAGAYRIEVSQPVATPPDDFANSLTDPLHPFGLLTVGGAIHGALTTGDRDWVKVDLNAGVDFVISVRGLPSGGGTLEDPYLRLHDASGAQLSFNDDIAQGIDRDSRLVFHPTVGGTYYIEAGAFADNYEGTYTVTVAAAVATSTAGNDDLVGAAGGATIMAGAGDDTVIGGDGANYLRGEDGNDAIQGGSGFDDINGNMGNDTAHGGAGDDWVVGGKDNDSLSGDGGSDLVYGNLANDTLQGGSGNDIVRGGQGDDVLDGGFGNDFVSGDRGSDTVTGGYGADIFHTSQDAGIDRVLDFYQSEGDRVMLDPGTTYTVSQVGADTVIDLGAGNQMVLVGVTFNSLTPGWIFGA